MQTRAEVDGANERLSVSPIGHQDNLSDNNAATFVHLSNHWSRKPSRCQCSMQRCSTSSVANMGAWHRIKSTECLISQ